MAWMCPYWVLCRLGVNGSSALTAALACRLAANLLDTIREDFKKAYPSAPAPPASGQYEPPPPPPAPAAPSWAHTAGQPVGAAPQGQQPAGYYPPPPSAPVGAPSQQPPAGERHGACAAIV